MSIFLFTVEQKPNRILNKKAIFCEQRTKKDVPMMSYRHSYNVQKDDSSQPTKILFISKTLKVKKKSNSYENPYTINARIIQQIRLKNYPFCLDSLSNNIALKTIF